MSKLSYKTLLIIFFSLLIAIVALWKFVLPKQKVSAAWWNDGWNYRVAVNIGNTGSSLTNFQVPINIGTSALINSGKMQSDCDDVRVVDQNGNLLTYWISGCNTTSTQIWPKIPSIPNGGAMVYIYYGNPSATSVKSTVGTSDYPGLSCKSILDAGNSTGNNTYWIDPTNGDTSDKFQAYCDMTNDSGGWMLVTQSMINSEVGVSTTVTKTVGANNGLIYTTTINGSGCNSYYSKFYLTDIIPWTKIKADYQFLGGNSCWGIFGNTNYSGGGSNLITFSSGTDTIRNQVKMGGSNGDNFDGVTSRCDNETYNFWHSNQGVGTTRSAQVILRRNSMSSLAGLATGAACVTNGYPWKYQNIYIREDAMTFVTTATPSTEEAGGGPIAYWKFDEGNGTTAYDSAENNNGTLTGYTLPEWQTEDRCISGKCLNFNGDTTHSVISDNNILINSDQTFSVWFYPTQFSGLDGIFTTHNHSTTSNIGINLDDNKITVSIGYTDGTREYNTKRSNFTVPLNRWTYATLVFKQNENTISLFVNGKIDNSWNLSKTVKFTSDKILAGQWSTTYTSSYRFYGMIDELKIYPYARTADQIKQDYNSRGSLNGSSVNLGVQSSTAPAISSKLIAYYKFDEGSGTTVNNSGNGGSTLNGTFATGNSAPTWNNDGKFNKALSFNNNQYLSNNSTINNVRAISYWVKANSTDENIMDLGNNAYIRSNGFLSGLVNANSTTYIDGVKETLGSEMVINGNMETGNPPTNWNPSGGCWTTGINDERTGGSGIQSINIGSTYNSWVAPIPGSTLIGGKLYRISGWLKAVPSYNSTTGLIISNSSYQTITSSSYSGTTWQKSILHFIAPTSTFSFLTLSGNNPRYGQFDDISIKEVTSVIPANNWHHIVIVLDSPINITNLTIGKVGNTFFNGLIDEVKIYNTALTADEIKQDYNQGSAISFGATNQTIGNTTTSLEYCIPGDTSYCANPIAEWKMDEKTGTTAKDTSGNNNNGTISGATWTSGKIGAGLNFDGNNDYITITNSTSIQQTGDYTLESWFKPTNNTSVFFILKNGEYGFKWNGGTSALQYYDEGYFNSTKTSWNLNQWYHLSMVAIGNTVNLYIDGKLDSSNSSTNSHNTTYNLEFGRYSSYFSGQLDNVRLYNYARTPAQIAYDYNKGAPVGWWKFDDCQGLTAFDSSGLGNTGTISIGPSGTQNSAGTCQIGTSAAWTNGAIGKYNSSLNFDGTDDYFRINQPNFQTIPNSFTVTGFINPETQSGFLITPSSNGIDQHLGFDNGNQRLVVYIAESSDTNERSRYSTSGSVPSNKWTHFAVSINDKNIKIYINGILNSEYNETINIGGWSSYWYIGQRSNSTNWYKGKMDDLRVYNYPLTTEQIKTVYNNGAVNFQ